MSGGRCAFPDCEQVLVERVAATWVTQGEIAHIHAHSEGGARFNSTLAIPQRDSYDNTLLLCRRHHRLVDADEASYPAEMLKEWKRDHEARHGRHDIEVVLRAGLLSPAPYPERHVSRGVLAAAVLSQTAAGHVALSGVSGSGKTTLAREVLDLAGDANLRFWLRGHDELALLTDLAALGVLFNLPVPAQVDAQAVRPVIDALSARPDWFLVLDDVRDINTLRHMPAGSGRVLLTTQHAALPGAHTVAVEPLQESETRAVLSTAVGLASADANTMRRMAELSEGLPLAAAQIAAFSAASGIPAADHLALLEQRRAELLDQGELLHHETFYASIEMTVGKLSEDGRSLLTALCALDDAPIPLPHPVAEEQPLAVLRDRLSFEGAAAELRRFSLLTREADTFRVHSLVREVTRTLDIPDRPQLERCAYALAAYQCPEWSARADSWAVMQALEPHLLLTLTHEAFAGTPVAAFVANKLGPYLSARGRAEEAREVLTRGMDGLDPTSTEAQGWRGSLLQNLANALADVGDLVAAEAAMRESLSMKTAAYGAQDRLTALAHAGLGNILQQAGRPEEALAEHEHALEVYTRLGDAALMADALADIALIVSDDAELSEQHLQRAEQLIADQPDAWTTQHQVLMGRVSVAEQAENWDEAIGLAVEAVELARAHADVSPELASAQGAHGRLLWHAGHPEESLRLLRVAFETHRRTGDVNSPAAARVQGNLGYYGLRAGMDADEAVQHLTQSLDTLRAALPAEHISVRTAEDMLGQVLHLLLFEWGTPPGGGTSA